MKHRWYSIVLLLLLAACNPSSDNTAAPTLASLPVEIRTLEAWQTAHGTINAPDERQEWQFFGRAGQDVRVRVVTQDDPVTLTLMLRGRVLAEGASVELKLPEDEVYRVTVRLLSGTASNYDIGFSYPNEPNPNLPTPLPEVVGIPTPTPPYADLGEFMFRIEEPAEIGGILTAASPRHVYTFAGTADAIVTLELFRIAGTLDPTMTLYDPDGNPIATDDNSAGNGNARLLNIRLPVDGLYSVQVHGAGFFGDYTLRYRVGMVAAESYAQPTPVPTEFTPYRAPTVGPALRDQRLEDHVPVIGHLRREGDFERFSFVAEANDSISISISPYDESTIQPRFEVFDPDGALIAAEQSSSLNLGGTALLTGISVAEAGAYIILVMGEENSTGPFLISVGRGTSALDVYQGRIESNIRASGTLQQRAERHTWLVTLHPGDVITAAASPTGNDFDPVLELTTSDGRVLYRDDNSGANNAALIDIAPITEPATYLLRVYDARGDKQGSYVVLWRYVNAALTPTPVPDLIPILSVDDEVEEGQYQFYVFQGKAGQHIQIRVLAAPDSNLDPVAALLDPNGNLIAEGDDNDGLNPLFNIVLPEDGSYSVRVNGYLSSGRFDLFVAELI